MNANTLKKYLDKNQFPLYGGDKWKCRKCGKITSLNNFYLYKRKDGSTAHLHKPCTIKRFLKYLKDNYVYTNGRYVRKCVS